MTLSYVDFTEIAGDEVSREQVDRMCNRYYWAGDFCDGKDVLEVACGSGQGLGYLANKANSMMAGDIDAKLIEITRNHYGDRVDLKQFGAEAFPCEDNSLDVILLFEAIYYLPDVPSFVKECRRVLREDGVVLIATANKDLYDFNPSPHSHDYYGVVELSKLFNDNGFEPTCFGDTPLAKVGLVQRVLRLVKVFAVKFNLMPKTMGAKKFLKRFVFGKLVAMPAEIDANTATRINPTPLDLTQPDMGHKVIYCAAQLRSEVPA